MTPPQFTVDTCDSLVEVTVYDGGAGLSTLLTASDWVAVSERAELLEPVRELRRRRSVEAAREASSHEARASRR